MNDEDAISGLLVQILTLSGYVTEVARDGTEAIALIRKAETRASRSMPSSWI
jgi:DNA-binding response OmpR family regulator